MQKVLIPVSNPKARFINRKSEFLKAAEAVIEKGMYILGDEVSSFEKEFAQYIGVNHCVGVANGTDALMIALRGLGVNAGDEVITANLLEDATLRKEISYRGKKPNFTSMRSVCPNFQFTYSK